MRCIQESIRVLRDEGLLILIFETDNWIRRLTLKTGIFQSDQYYFRTREVIHMMKESGLQIVADGPVMKFPIEIYRKLPFTRLLASLDSSRYWPGIFSTLGFVIGRKLEGSKTHEQVLSCVRWNGSVGGQNHVPLEILHLSNLGKLKRGEGLVFPASSPDSSNGPRGQPHSIG